MKKKLVDVLNVLGLIIIVVTGLLFLEYFSMGILESIRFCVMSLYVYIALATPWLLEASKKKKIVSALCMLLYPLGLISTEWWYCTAIAVIFSIYLFVSYEFLEEGTRLEA